MGRAFKEKVEEALEELKKEDPKATRLAAQLGQLDQWIEKEQEQIAQDEKHTGIFVFTYRNADYLLRMLMKTLGITEPKLSDYSQSSFFLAIWPTPEPRVYFFVLKEQTHDPHVGLISSAKPPTAPALSPIKRRAPAPITEEQRVVPQISSKEVVPPKAKTQELASKLRGFFFRRRLGVSPKLDEAERIPAPSPATSEEKDLFDTVNDILIGEE